MGRPKKTAEAALLDLGADEGAEIKVGDMNWPLLVCPVGSVLEVALNGSSLGLGATTEAWLAVLVTGHHTSAKAGTWLQVEVLGCESDAALEDATRILTLGYLHLCSEDPCPHGTEEDAVHVTTVRCWLAEHFKADYLSPRGTAALRRAVEAGKGLATGVGPPSSRPAPRRARVPKEAARPKTSAAAKKRKEANVIEVAGSEDEGFGDDLTEAGPPDRAALRETLRRTKERILGGTKADSPRTRGGGPAGGSGLRLSKRVQEESHLVAGTALNPGRSTPLRVAQLEDTREEEGRSLIKRLEKSSDASAVLLARAVQSSQSQVRKEKNRKERDRKSGLQALMDLIKGKKKKKKKKKKGDRKRKQPSGKGHIKPDPDDSGGGSGSSGSSSSSSSRGQKRRRSSSDEESEMSCEPPLRRRAAREPGSVMTMLVKHAQEQLDRGALLEQEGEAAGLTTGVKISTFFALLIRPYYPAGNALMRELYSLGQTIDLLRSGRLPEAAGALASRFIAVHTALAEGGWSTASQLELYPLEPVQSASVATMLQAQKHRRLVQRSQGFSPSRWTSGNKGKGKGGSWSEKGQKGENKGKGKGKGRNGKKGDVAAWKETQEEPAKK